MFTAKDENHRRKFALKHQTARTNLKQMCISAAGVKLWNSQHNDFKGCSDVSLFKKIYKEKTIRQTGILTGCLYLLIYFEFSLCYS